MKGYITKAVSDFADSFIGSLAREETTASRLHCVSTPMHLIVLEFGAFSLIRLPLKLISSGWSLLLFFWFLYPSVSIVFQTLYKRSFAELLIKRAMLFFLLTSCETHVDRAELPTRLWPWSLPGTRRMSAVNHKQVADREGLLIKPCSTVEVCFPHDSCAFLPREDSNFLLLAPPRSTQRHLCYWEFLSLALKCANS